MSGRRVRLVAPLLRRRERLRSRSRTPGRDHTTGLDSVPPVGARYRPRRRTAGRGLLPVLSDATPRSAVTPFHFRCVLASTRGLPAAAASNRASSPSVNARLSWRRANGPRGEAEQEVMSFPPDRELHDSGPRSMTSSRRSKTPGSTSDSAPIKPRSPSHPPGSRRSLTHSPLLRSNLILSPKANQRELRRSTAAGPAVGPGSLCPIPTALAAARHNSSPS